MKSTNYYNTFIQVAEDTKADKSVAPPQRAEPSVAQMQFEMISKHPYQYTSDDILFTTHAKRNDIPQSELPREREKFFSKGQACLRACALAKTYGWGIHHNAEGKIAIAGIETDDYEKFVSDTTITQVKAMRNKRA